jgi:hypothetical protein
LPGDETAVNIDQFLHYILRSIASNNPVKTKEDGGKGELRRILYYIDEK